jgi:hypothetical protein
MNIQDLTPQKYKQNHFDAGLFIKSNRLILLHKYNDKHLYTDQNRLAIYFIQTFSNVTVTFVYKANEFYKCVEPSQIKYFLSLYKITNEGLKTVNF